MMQETTHALSGRDVHTLSMYADLIDRLYEANITFGAAATAAVLEATALLKRVVGAPTLEHVAQERS